MRSRDGPGMVHWYGSDMWRSLRGLWRATDVLGILDARRILPWEAGWRIESLGRELSVHPHVVPPVLEANFLEATVARTAGGKAPPLPVVGFDFVADTGDGWNETFVLAYQLTRAEIPIPALGRSLPRGSFLVMGGDEVYPVASDEEYEKRLLNPFEAARREVHDNEGPPVKTPVFAVPGNHDWYDGLTAFANLFCRPPVIDESLAGLGPESARCAEPSDTRERPRRRLIGCFRPSQDVSYFAFPIAYGWHLWALDIQLTEDLDRVQEAYFRAQADDLSPGDRVILCAATPEITYGRRTGARLQGTLQSICRLVQERNARVPLQLSGDSHNYQHYVKTEEALAEGPPTAEQTIVCGGGGAARFPTHARVQNPDAECVEIYPSEAQSRRKALGLFLLFRWAKGGFIPAALAGLYVLLTFLLAVVPVAGLLAGLLVVGGLGVLASSLDKAAGGSTRWQPWALGIAHGVLQVGACCGVLALGREALGWPSPWLLVLSFGLAVLALLSHLLVIRGGRVRPIGPLLGGAALLGLLLLFAVCDAGGAYRVPIAFLLLAGSIGALLGSFLVGAYFYLALQWLESHQSAAFSALRIPDYMSFLRLRFSPSGDLDVHALGIDRVPRGGSAEVSVRLIEEIHIPGSSSSAPAP